MALLAKILISAGCAGSSVEYRQACAVGSSQALRSTKVEELSNKQEQAIKNKAEDFANIYLVPYFGEKTIVVAAGSIDLISKGRLSYAFRTKNIDSVMVKAEKNNVSIDFNWNF